MSLVLRAVAKQVLDETQRLAQSAKWHTGFSNNKIERALHEMHVMRSKKGADFAAFLCGKKSKAAGIFQFRKKLEAANFLPPSPDLNTAHGQIEAFFFYDLSRNSVVLSEEANKIRTFYVAREKAASALRELAKVIDQPELSATNEITNFCLDEASECRRRYDQSSGENENPVTQLSKLADHINCLQVFANSDWDYSSLEAESGAKVVQSKRKNEDKSSKMKTTKKTKNL